MDVESASCSPGVSFCSSFPRALASADSAKPLTRVPPASADFESWWRTLSAFGDCLSDAHGDWCPWKTRSPPSCHGRSWAAFPHFRMQNDSLLSVVSHTHTHTHTHNGSNSVYDMFRSAPYKQKAVPQQAFANLTLRMPTVFKPLYKTAFISRGVHDMYMGSAWCLAHVLVSDWPALNNDALPLSTDGTITIVMKISNHGNMLTKYGI